MSAIVVFNVRDYGAVGDGVTDDTAAFQAARDEQVARDGGLIYVPMAPDQHSYVVSSVNLTGLNDGQPVPFILLGEEPYRTQLQAKGDNVVMFELGKGIVQLGSWIANIWIRGTSTSAGAIRLGSANGHADFTKLHNIRISTFTRAATTSPRQAAGYALSLEAVQELDAYNCRLDSNTVNIYRPNWGYVTTTNFHGQAGYNGDATDRGVDIAGAIADITFDHQAFEKNVNFAIRTRFDNAPGTVQGTGGGNVTFTQSQTGLIDVDGYFTAGGNEYILKSLAANGLSGTIVAGLSGGNVMFAATTFTFGTSSRIVVADCYFELNGKHISLTGNTSPYSQVEAVIIRNQLNHTTAGAAKIELDQVTRSLIANNHALTQSGDITTTANTQCHFRDNAVATSAVDMLAVYSALTGNISAEDYNKSTGTRFFYGEPALANSKAFRSHNAAGTGLKKLIRLNAADRVEIGEDATSVYFPMTTGGAVLFGTTVATNANACEPILANGKSLRGVTAGATDTKPLIKLDANDIPQLGANDGGSVSSLVKIGAFTNANLPAAGATKNGSLALDTTNKRLVYYAAGLRYFLPIGTSF